MCTYPNFTQSFTYFILENISTSFIPNSKDWKQLPVDPSAVASSSDSQQPATPSRSSVDASHRHNRKHRRPTTTAHVSHYPFTSSAKAAEQTYFAGSQDTGSLRRGRWRYGGVCGGPLGCTHGLDLRVGTSVCPPCRRSASSTPGSHVPDRRYVMYYTLFSKVF